MIRIKKGFTLIELLVVIAIIGLLSAIILAALQNAKLSAHDATRLSEVHEIRNALELYYSKNGSYPSGKYDSTLTVVTNNVNPWSALASQLTPTYIGTLPLDPVNGGGEGLINAGTAKYYYASTDGKEYIISVRLATNLAQRTGNKCPGPTLNLAACDTNAPYFSLVGGSCNTVTGIASCQ